jgi:hypothetical protein
MTARIRKSSKFDPTAGFFDSRRLDILGKDSQDELDFRLAKLMTAITCTHASQSNDVQYLGPASAAITSGLKLMLDCNGVSEKLLEELSQKGVAVNAKHLRKCLVQAAAAIDSNSIREHPPDGYVPVLALTADNADFHLFSRVFSVIASANILIGYEKREDMDTLNSRYLEGLPLPAVGHADKFEITEEDDRIAKTTIQYQNVHAILEAALHGQEPFLNSVDATTLQSRQWKENDVVNFKYCHVEHTGKVVQVGDNTLVVSYEEPNGDTATTSISWLDVLDDKNDDRAEDQTEGGVDDDRDADVLPRNPQGPNNGDADVVIEEDEADEEWTEFLKQYRVGIDDGAGRHKALISTTIVTDILTGVSSKNHEAAQTVLERAMERFGKDEWWQSVHMLVADQEFMPTFYRLFFTSLDTEEAMPLILMLAMGHGMKSIAVSMMTYYKSLFDPLLSPVKKRAR